MEQSTPEASRAAVVLPAGGSGERMGGQKKQFRLLGDAPVFIQTIRAFRKVEEVDEIVLVVPVSEMDHADRELSSHNVEASIVAGGDTRQESVDNGLTALSDRPDVVLVHDAVRPFIQPSKIEELIKGVGIHGAAALAIPVSDTLRRADDSIFRESVDRTDMFRMQTPQGARFPVMKEAFRLAETSGFIGTDEVALLQRAGYEIHLLLGDERNIKITHPSDWLMAEVLWLAWSKEQAQ